VEIRAALGVADAADAADFTAALLRELTRLAEQRGWCLQIHALEEAAPAGVRRVEVEILGGGPAHRVD
jgi:protein subunit release factor B